MLKGDPLYRKMLQMILWFGMRNRRVLLVDIVCLAGAVFVGYSMRLSYLLGMKYFHDFLMTVLAFLWS